MKIKNAYEVATHRLCLGCGACVWACPEKKVQLVDIIDEGRRPVIAGDGCNDCERCLQVCPGLGTKLDGGSHQRKGIDRLKKRWGIVQEVWEGFATDPEIRYQGASGGLCTALALFCLENACAGGVLHIAADKANPWKNSTFLSNTRSDVVRRTGSRYAPASPCEGLGAMEFAQEPTVFIGKPCDVAGLRLAQNLSPRLREKTALAIGFFCAGTPSTRGTLDLLQKHDVDPESITELRYRGRGWPGMATVRFKQEDISPLELSYKDSWGFLQKYRPFRCYLCPDLTAEFADISVGDPWNRDIAEDDYGRSLILIRTELGRKIFHKAMEAGYVEAVSVEPEALYRSQRNLLGKRQAIWGRVFAMKMLGIPYPKLEGFHLFQNWMEQSFSEKLRSVFGTIRRIIQRNYFKPFDYSI